MKSVLHVNSECNEGKPADMNIARISKVLNFLQIDTLVYIHLQAGQTRTVLDNQLLCYILQV